MLRREFVGACFASTIAAGVTIEADAKASAFERVQLVDVHNVPIKASALKRNTNYVFNYPFEATPCFLLNLDRAIIPTAGLKTEAGVAYASRAGVGKSKSIVAFSAICAHKLAYPSPQVSFISFKEKAPKLSPRGQVISCCADHSVYDPFAGAKVIAGPAPQPLAGITLEHDAKTDALFAIGTLGGDKFNAFFEKYAFKLALERGGKTGDQRVRRRSVVTLLDNYSTQTAQC